MDAIDAIMTRKSVRAYKQLHVEDALLENIMRAGTRAPSGMANEPWRFSVVREGASKSAISKLTKHTDIILQADALICLFMDTSVGYDTVKDANTMGACAQNMLLCAHALGLGAVWIAEIRRNKAQVAAACNVDANRYDLILVMPIGYSDEDAAPRPRKHKLEDVVLSRV